MIYIYISSQNYEEKRATLSIGFANHLVLITSIHALRKVV